MASPPDLAAVVRAFAAMPPPVRLQDPPPHGLRGAPAAPAPPPGPQTTAVVHVGPEEAHLANAAADRGDPRAEKARRDRFVAEFQRSGFNPIEAARKAGYASPIIDGPRVAALAGVKKAIAAALSAQLSAADYTPEWVMASIGATAAAQVHEMWDPVRNKIRSPDELPPALKRALKRARVVNGVWDYEFHDGLAAHALLSKIHGMQKTVSIGHQTVAHKIDLTALRPEELDELLGLLPPAAEGDVEDAEFEAEQ